MHEVKGHEVDGQRMADALAGITMRASDRWYDVRYGGAYPEGIHLMRDELLDHVAARAATEPGLDGTARAALVTAAECSLGLLGVGCFPDGDQELFFPVVDETITTMDMSFGDLVRDAPTAATWLDAFRLCLVSGLVWEWMRVIGLLLREDYAPAVRDGVPYSRFDSVSDPADLAAMDALCGYLTPASGHLPGSWPTVTLRKPDSGERAESARKLDAAGPLTPDHRLLRVLLDDDRAAFEDALAARLAEHREALGAEPAPRTLLPLGALAAAALAVQVHGWEPAVRSDYLPAALLGSPDALRRGTPTAE
ncbi:immunity 49 family protein [Streptomyces sp. NPDC089799]|uniref:immunity 49 family protein n=1 Tax=Streptomyces sp. NPDC089799 TaxID=3155066 RepID=UPI0034407D9D